MQSLQSRSALQCPWQMLTCMRDAAMGHRGCICERGGGSFASRGRRPILCRDGTFNQWLRATSCLWRCRQRSRDDKDDNRHSRPRWPSSRTGVVLFIDLVDLDRDLYRGGVEKAKSHDERGVKQSSGSVPGPRSLPTRLRGREPLQMQAAVLCCSSSDRAALPLLLNNQHPDPKSRLLQIEDGRPTSHPVRADGT